MDYLPRPVFNRCVRRYNGNRWVKLFRCSDQIRCMAFAQLTYRESLRDTETCLCAQSNKLYHIGITGGASSSTLAKANQVRDWRIYADFAQRLIHTARRLYRDEDYGLDLSNTVYALDSSTIDQCLSLFPWAVFRKNKAAVKLHTLLDLHSNIPAFIHISDGKLYDVNIMDMLLPEIGVFYVMDRAYLGFARLFRLHKLGSFFVLQSKSNTTLRRLYSHPVDRSTGVVCDRTVRLTGVKTAYHYPEKLRRIKYHDKQRKKPLEFLTNNTALPALRVAQLYRSRWQVELFFKWIKQHLRIMSFFGLSENTVKSQIWISVSVYVLIAIIKKRLHSDQSLYTILQSLSLALFKKDILHQLITQTHYNPLQSELPYQLKLFD